MKRHIWNYKTCIVKLDESWKLDFCLGLSWKEEILLSTKLFVIVVDNIEMGFYFVHHPLVSNLCVEFILQFLSFLCISQKTRHSFIFHIAFHIFYGISNTWMKCYRKNSTGNSYTHLQSFLLNRLSVAILLIIMFRFMVRYFLRFKRQYLRSLNVFCL